MYIVLKDGEYFAYSEDKKLIKQFKKDRGEPYSVVKMSPDMINREKLMNDLMFQYTELYDYKEYGGIFSETELLEAEEQAFNIVSKMLDTSVKIHKMLSAIKMTKEERQTTAQFEHIILSIVEDIDDDSQVTYFHDYVDMVAIMWEFVVYNTDKR